MKTVVADVEADHFLRFMTRIWCIAIGDPDSDETTLYADQLGYPPLREGLKRLREADRVVFHNGLGYDLFAINKIYPDTLRFEQIYDTLIVSRMIDPDGSHSLAALGEQLGFSKGDHTDFSRFSPEMGTYCIRDVDVLKLVFKKVYPQGLKFGKSVEAEHRVQFVLLLQQEHGFRLDVCAAHKLEAVLRQEHYDIKDDLQGIFPLQYVPDKAKWDYVERCWSNIEVTTPKVGKLVSRSQLPKKYQDDKLWASLSSRERGLILGGRGDTVAGCPYTKIKPQPFNVGSRPQVVQRLTSKYDWVPTKFTKAGAVSVDDKVLNELIYDEAKPIARYYRVGKQLGQIADGDNAWLKLEENGRLHGYVNPLGARTHRMSHSKPNLAQVDKKDLRMREVWLPDEGDKLMGSDAQGLELRNLAHRLAPYDKGRYANALIKGRNEDGTDVHTMTQKAIGLYSRNSAKTLIYAHNYGSGDPNLGSIVVNDAKEAGKKRLMDGRRLPTTTKGLRKLGREVRRKLASGILGLDRLIKKVHSVHDKRGYFTGLDGRKIRSVSKHSSLNTLLQSDGAVIMKWALNIFHFELCVEQGHVEPVTYIPKTFNYCANVHDEVQLSVRPEHADELGKLFCRAIELAGERLGVRCPLAGSYDVGANWKETH